MSPAAAALLDELERSAAAVGRGRVEVEIDHPTEGAAARLARKLTARPARGRAAERRRARPAAGAALALDERAVLANQQIEVVALLVGELEEDLLALGVLEPLAVLLEEAVRAALAADADHQRLLIVDAAHQPLGAFGEQAVGGALEEQERRPRLELRIALQQLAVARLELAEVLLLLQREILEHLAAARVARHLRGARV